MFWFFEFSIDKIWKSFLSQTSADKSAEEYKRAERAVWFRTPAALTSCPHSDPRAFRRHVCVCWGVLGAFMAGKQRLTWAWRYRNLESPLKILILGVERWNGWRSEWHSWAPACRCWNVPYDARVEYSGLLTPEGPDPPPEQTFPPSVEVRGHII